MPDIVNELSCALPRLSKAVFSQPTDASEYKRITVRPIVLKGVPLFQLEGLRGDKAFHFNLGGEELLRFVRESADGLFRQAAIICTDGAAQYVLRRDGGYRKSGRGAAVPLPGGGEAHNREKKYILAEGEDIPALVDLGVFTQDLRVVKSKYDKYRQINRFVELVDDEFSAVEPGHISVLDFGCGKSYLTFILYYYFAVKRGFDVEMTGYDLKADVVAHCNAVAEKYGYCGLRFEVADVSRDALADREFDVLVTLHACDTATDYALDFAVKHGAKRIFSVPCCQHEINNSIHRGGELDVMLRHGIIKERMSALLTDAIRAEVLEDMGYSVDLIEFVDFEHSPKNIMIRARKRGAQARRNIPRCRELCEKYGFTQTLLELCDRGE